MKNNATCTGCLTSSAMTGEYSPEDPVEDDGTYFQGYFVCSECYCKLIDMRSGDFKPDIGPPWQVQKMAKELLRGKK